MSRGALSQRLVLPIAAYAVLLVSGLQTLVVPVVGRIEADLHVSPTSAAWVVTANLLAAAVLTPVVGRLGDLRGRRSAMIAVLAVVVAGSVLAATTSSLPLLLVARVLQASSFGLFPLSIGVLREELPPSRLTTAMALVSGMLAVGAGMGLVVTGLLMKGGGDYHALFWLSTALSLVGLAAVCVLPRRSSATRGRIDWTGAALLGLGLVLLLMPLEGGNSWGWGSRRVLGMLVAAGVVLAVFVLVERRVDEPLVTTRLLRHRQLGVANLAGLFFGLTLFVAFLGVSNFVQAPRGLAGYGFGATVLAASLYLLPGSLAGVFTSPLAGRLVARRGARLTLVLGTFFAIAGFAFLAAFHSMGWEIVAGSILVNTSVMFGYAAMPAIIVEHAAPSETGIANSLNAIYRSVGMALGAAFVVTVLTRNPIEGLPVPLPHEEQFVVVFTVAAVLGCVFAALVWFGLPARQPRVISRGRHAAQAATMEKADH
ncbi:MFS transporter [Actinacidiphila glaucinigra]|uniref:MFS transporter n=1 Tax=Actinacidiphila glaucinigra TaxID=235986 RepID=UPI003D8E79D5